MGSTPPTSAMGGSASSQADSLDERAWRPRPWISLSIGVVAVLVPLLASLVAVNVVASVVPRPEADVALVLWMVALIAVSIVTALTVQRLTQRLAPLTMLFKMSLVFPDEAPSRFRTALRAGSTRTLARSGHAPTGATPQAMAEEILALTARLTRHDRMTRGHSERVRAYSVMLGEEIGLGRDDLDKLNWAALIHDVGKLVVPAEILNKSGHPTDEEWAVLRGHPAAAAAYVEPLRAWLGDWVDAATQHHERFDGTGYPLGRSGNDISLAGRLVAIADAFDVMTAARSYKKPLPMAQARAELLRNAGTQFDPDLVRRFVEISIGHRRWVVGPIAWLAQLPDIVRAPLTSIATSTSGVMAAGAVAVAAGTAASTVPSAATPVQPAVVEQASGDLTAGSADPGRPSAPMPGEVLGAPGDPADGDGVAADPGGTPSDVPGETRADLGGPAPTLAVPPDSTGATRPPSPGSSVVSTTTSTTVVPSVVAVADTASTSVNVAVDVEVLENDKLGGLDEGQVTVQVAAGPAHGTTTVSEGNVTYQPGPGFTGTDSFTYTVCPPAGSCSQATVKITVLP